MDISEKKIEQYLKVECEKLGGMCLKTNASMYKGIPDRLILYRGVADFVEVKRKDGILSKAQKSFINKLNMYRFRVQVVYSKKDVDNYLKKRFAKPPKEEPDNAKE